MQKIMNRRFSAGERVEMDGKHFIGCEFNGCEVVYGGAEVKWEGCRWANCRITLIEAANRTVQALAGWGYQIIPPAGGKN